MTAAEENEKYGKRMTARKKIFSLLGLAMRAGKITSGEFMTEKSIRSGLAYLVIAAEDSSDNTKKNFKDSCAYYDVPIYLFASKEELGHCMGKQFRASLSVNDQGFAESLKKLFAELENN